MDESDSSDCDVGPTLPPHMRTAGRDHRATKPKQSRLEDPGDAIGPVRPPHLKRTQHSNEETASSTEDCDPALPAAVRQNDGRTGDSSNPIGPALPPHLMKTNNSNTTNEEPDKYTLNRGESDGEEGTYGPALPPSLTSSKHPSDDSRTGGIGPALPPGFRKMTADEDESGDDSDSEGESSDEEVIGPMLPTAGASSRQRSVAEELEARAAAMKDKLTRKVEEGAPARDSWMTELPENSSNFGLGARTFRKHARPDEKDRSGWTDTPADTARKQQERAEKAATEMQALSSSSSKEKKKKKREEKQLSERDKRLAREVSKHNQATRPESLMDMHAKSRKRKLKEEGTEEQERRPFDRETDLHVNRFDEARRKQLVKKSAILGTKFSHGSEKTYL